MTHPPLFSFAYALRLASHDKKAGTRPGSCSALSAEKAIYVSILSCACEPLAFSQGCFTYLLFFAFLSMIIAVYKPCFRRHSIRSSSLHLPFAFSFLAYPSRLYHAPFFTLLHRTQATNDKELLLPPSIGLWLSFFGRRRDCWGVLYMAPSATGLRRCRFRIAGCLVMLRCGEMRILSSHCHSICSSMGWQTVTAFQ